ncbi:hypothetical protein KVR01_012733 [Diaporthe batatas]|uniref:uncharacterized protein n=1 Tax=Diaporthe batatas TaxID=748121 RepID=UPI001D051E6E|nr:uncharacterized protein KVR01_012733 [Diaporthe batatas]KAG8157349.1 hypothetical protein KVR01_012733 [Diaporthe batatas]
MSSALVQRVKDGDKPILTREPAPVPQPGPHELLIKVSHVAQNPTDVQSFDTNAFGDGTVLGCDFVGTIEKSGAEVSRAKEGDIIAGLIWGGEIKGLGAFAEHTIADERISFKVPSSVPLAEAATVPLAAATAWLALFSKDSLYIPRSPGKELAVLIWGGSSCVGQFAVQISAMHGFKVITTCSEHNFDLVKSLGAHHVFNYRDSDVVKKVRDVAPDLEYVFDTIGNSDSSTLASQGIKESGGRLCTVRPGKVNTESVSKQTTVTDVLVWTAFLKDHRYKSFFWPANQSDHDLTSELFERLPEWLESGKIRPSTAKVLKGLDAVVEGFQEHRDGKISAYKIVYEI